jgi:hypothetical protein
LKKEKVMKPIVLTLLAVLLVFSAADLSAVPRCGPYSPQLPGEEQPECDPEPCDVNHEELNALFIDGSELWRSRGIDDCTGEVVYCTRTYSCPSGGGEYSTEGTCQAQNAYNANTVLPCN